MTSHSPYGSDSGAPRLPTLQLTTHSQRLNNGKLLGNGCCARAVHLDTLQMPRATHSDRGLEAFHCSSAVSGKQLNRVHLKVTRPYYPYSTEKLQKNCSNIFLQDCNNVAKCCCNVAILQL